MRPRPCPCEVIPRYASYEHPLSQASPCSPRGSATAAAQRRLLSAALRACREGLGATGQGSARCGRTTALRPLQTEAGPLQPVAGPTCWPPDRIVGEALGSFSQPFPQKKQGSFGCFLNRPWKLQYTSAGHCWTWVLQPTGLRQGERQVPSFPLTTARVTPLGDAPTGYPVLPLPLRLLRERRPRSMRKAGKRSPASRQGRRKGA